MKDKQGSVRNEMWVEIGNRIIYSVPYGTESSVWEMIAFLPTFNPSWILKRLTSLNG